MRVERQELTAEKCKDAGLALVLLCLIAFFGWGRRPAWVLLAIAFLVVVMTYPPVLRPFARFWFGLSTALGTVVSKIILAALFYGLVLPVGLVRRALGKDAMRLKSWKRGADSVFRKRGHRFVAADLEHPY